MKIDELKTKVKIIFPDACEIFLAEEAKDSLVKTLSSDKLIELDFTKVESIDTSFIQLILSYLKTLKNEGKKFEIKGVSETVNKAFDLYGLDLKKTNVGE